MKVVQPFLSFDSLKLIYYSYFHAILSYGIIFWGNSSHSNSVFKMQKKAIRIITGARNRDSCKEYFKKLNMLPLQSQYLLSLSLFVAENSDYFSFNTKNKCNLHLPSSKLAVFQKGPYYSGIKAFNNLPTYIKSLLKDKKQFKLALKKFFHLYTFYNLNDFYNYNK